MNRTKNVNKFITNDCLGLFTSYLFLICYYASIKNSYVWPCWCQPV